MMLYRGTANPRTVNFLANMTDWHQRNQLMFDPRVGTVTALERCYYWWRSRRKPDPVIIAEVAGEFRLVSGVFAWIAYAAKNQNIDVDVYSEQLVPTLVDHYQDASASISLDIIEQSRVRFNYFENTYKLPNKPFQLRLIYNKQGLSKVLKIGQGQQARNVNWSHSAAETLAEAFTLADNLYY